MHNGTDIEASGHDHENLPVPGVITDRGTGVVQCRLRVYGLSKSAQQGPAVQCRL